jgi:hypothetical protein
VVLVAVPVLLTGNAYHCIEIGEFAVRCRVECLGRATCGKEGVVTVIYFGHGAAPQQVLGVYRHGKLYNPQLSAPAGGETRVETAASNAPHISRPAQKAGQELKRLIIVKVCKNGYLAI